MLSNPDNEHTLTTKEKRLGAIVAEHMKVLHRPAASPAKPTAAIQRDVVRSRLKLDREQGRLPLEHIRPDPDQPRKVNTSSDEFRDMVGSIRDRGVLQPIVVRYIHDQDYFQIIAGERRFRAARAAGLKEIPAVVRDRDDTQAAIDQIVENIQREGLNPIDEAAALKRILVATGDTHEELAKRIGKKRVYVTKILTIDEQLTRKEKTILAQCSPANMPGISLIYEALQASRPEMRAQILSGQLKRGPARKAIAETRANRLGRPKGWSYTYAVGDVGAIVTVKFPKQARRPLRDILHALEVVRRQVRSESEAR